MRKISTLIQLCLLAFLPLSLQATHIVGGEMTYRCLGNDNYEIKLTIFRDCFNGIPWFDNPASIGIFDNNSNLFIDQLLVPLDLMLNDTIDPTLDDDCLAVPPNVCVNTTTYTTVVNLPFRPGGYHLVYQRCCRNNTIVNLIAPEDVGATYNVVLTEEAMIECNASPEFVDWPPLYLCANVPFEIDQSAIDTDGDSLVYKLCNPLTGANDIVPMPQPPNPPPYDTVPWLPPFDAGTMINIPPDAPMVIDSETGILTGTPTILGQFVIGICIEEYRNGELIGEYRRDYQVNIGDCEAIVASAASPEIQCGSRTVNFQNESINANDFEWQFNDPGNPGAISTATNATYTFSDWGVYEVWLIAEPGAICADTAVIEVSVQPESVVANFETNVDECLDEVQISLTDLSSDVFSAITNWEWTLTFGPEVYTSDEQNPTFVVAPPGGAIITLIVTNEVGCTAIFEDIIPIKPPLINLELGPDINECSAVAVTLDAGPGFIEYLWNDASTGQTLEVTNPGFYAVTVVDACGKVAVDEINVSLDSVEIDAGPDVEICEGDSHMFSVSTDFESYVWSPAATLSCSDCPDPTATPTVTTVYTVTGTTADGCVSSDSATVFVLLNIETLESRDVCEGDSTIVFGDVITSSGVFSETFVGQNGCDSTHTITVNVIEGVETEEEIGICEGDTAIVFGNQVSMAGVFTETFTGQNGCDSTHTVTVSVFPVYQIIEDAQICEGDTVVIFGTPVTTPGEFSDTLTTVNGCDSILTVNLAVLPNTFTSENVSICFGTTTDIFGAQVGAAGVYEMTFTASNGCDSTHTITLEVYDEITINIETTDATCFGFADGTATATAAGGNGGFTYAWSNGDMVEVATGLSAGSYTVTVTDVTGCTAEASVTIGEPTAVAVSATGIDVSCTALGSVSATASGGTGNITFEWNTGDMTADVSDLEAGVYSVTATDENSCTAMASVEIMGALSPEVNITVDQQLTEDDPDGGELSVAITGGTMPYDIEWSNGGTTDSLFNLSSGQYIVTVTDAEGCEVLDTAYLFVEACTGGKIWKDANRNGCQDPGEVGIPDVEMSLLGVDIWGNSITGVTTSMLNGEYIFEGLPPGEYLIFMDIPDNYTLSPQDACDDDFVDSDFDVNGVATELVILTEGHCCLIIDGGLYDDCLNVFDPGEICCDQVLCGPGNLAAPITSVSLPGGANQVEYRWIFSETNSSLSGGTAWQQVEDVFGNPVTSTTLNPGPIYVTTYFARCVRAVGCTEWLVTDVVTITVDDEAVAEINEPDAICVGDNITFTAASNHAGANYLWNFGPTASPQFSNDPAPTVTFNQSGYPMVWLTVTNNGCTSTDQLLIAVSSDPVYCGTAIVNPGNGGNGSIIPNGISKHDFLVYPNPVTDQLTVEWDRSIDSGVQVEILSMEGKILQSEKIGANNFAFNTNLNHLNAGIYMLRVRHGDGEQEVFKLVKQ